MHVKVPEMRKCCFCVPLRPGIILCGYININFSFRRDDPNAFVEPVAQNECTDECIKRALIVEVGAIFMVFALFALACLVITVELKKSTVTNDASIEAITSTVLFCILGMSVLLNVMLLVAGFQKDISMLRLYNYFALATTFAMLVPALVLLFRLHYVEWLAAFGAIVMQCYVIVLVRSEVIRLETKLCNRGQRLAASTDQVIDVPDTDTLI